MGDRFYEDLEIALSSYSKRSVDDYDDEEEETEGEYEDEYVNDVENEPKSDELACPFCSEDFDVLGLCCHIDADHRIEVKPGNINSDASQICPVCATKHRSARSRSAIFLLRKDLQDKHLRCIKESPSADSSSNAAADSMLLSFVNNPSHYTPQANESASLTGPSLSTENLRMILWRENLVVAFTLFYDIYVLFWMKSSSVSSVNLWIVGT
ncbi:protein dehydration-induced [Sesamum angolense]|uniref:Protein dehydration-induced n=1 Tax=Sesamum angolense TaxID=2727404 RepID=A0AAE1XAT8_9LAMI|nr:protein dehydration-induced [Sesamum angolense]